MTPPEADPEFAAMMRAGLAPTPFVFPGQRLFQHLFVPAFLVLSVLPWMYGTRAGAPVSAASTSLAIALAMFATWIAEQLYPARREWNVRLLQDGRAGGSRLLRDLVYLIGVTQISAALLAWVDPSVRAAVHSVGAGGVLILWPSGAPFFIRVALAFLLVELLSYWIHRAAHRFRLLWQFHSTHHVITELNAFKSVRTHPLDNLVFHLVRVTPLLLLGAGPNELAAAIYFGALFGILAHANLQLREGPLGWFLNYPRWHAVHHSSDLAEGQSNFGCHTVLWDRVFGTFRAPSESPAPVGVHPVGPRSLWQELAWPLYRSVTPEGPSQAGR